MMEQGKLFKTRFVHGEKGPGQVINRSELLQDVQGVEYTLLK